MGGGGAMVRYGADMLQGAHVGKTTLPEPPPPTVKGRKSGGPKIIVDR
jgi:hypothetical protein